MAIEKRRGKNGLTYRVNWRNPHTKKIDKSETFYTLADARRFEEQIKIRLEFEPESFIPDTYIPHGKLPISELLRLYLEEATMTASTRKMTFYHVRALLPHLPLVDSTELKRSHLRDAERTMRETGVKQNTVQRRVSILKSALNWAVEEEMMEDSPLGGYRCRRGEDQKFIPPTPREAAAIYEAAPPHVRRALVLAWHLGVRPGASELFRLSWDNVDLESNKILVWSAKKNANNIIRELDIVEPLAMVMEAWKKEDISVNAPWIIHYRGAPVDSIKTAWRYALMGTCILRRIRPYDLRHAFATYALADGADIKSVAGAMGHASTTMVHRHYQHVLDKQKLATMKSVPVFLEDVKDQTPPIPVSEQEPPKWKN